MNKYTRIKSGSNRTCGLSRASITSTALFALCSLFSVSAAGKEPKDRIDAMPQAPQGYVREKPKRHADIDRTMKKAKKRQVDTTPDYAAMRKLDSGTKGPGPKSDK